jgi:metal-sulfur cluster biosynthetic enzyme
MPDRAGGLEQEIRERLNEIQDPCSVAAGTATGLVDMGLVEEVAVSAHGDVRVNLRLTSPTCNMLGYMAEEANAKVRELSGVRSVEVVADQGLDWSPSMMSPEAQERRRARVRMLHERARQHRQPARRAGQTTS